MTTRWSLLLVLLVSSKVAMAQRLPDMDNFDPFEESAFDFVLDRDDEARGFMIKFVAKGSTTFYSTSTPLGGIIGDMFVFEPAARYNGLVAHRDMLVDLVELSADETKSVLVDLTLLYDLDPEREYQVRFKNLVWVPTNENEFGAISVPVSTNALSVSLKEEARYSQRRFSREKVVFSGGAKSGKGKGKNSEMKRAGVGKNSGKGRGGVGKSGSKVKSGGKGKRSGKSKSGGQGKSSSSSAPSMFPTSAPSQNFPATFGELCTTEEIENIITPAITEVAFQVGRLLEVMESCFFLSPSQSEALFMYDGLTQEQENVRLAFLDLFQVYFGNFWFNRDILQVIYNKFLDSFVLANNGGVNFVCDTFEQQNPGCFPGVIAYVDPEDTERNVFLCASFFVISPHLRTGTVLHEFTHIFFNEVQTLDYCYGSACQTFAAQFPLYSAFAADSYAELVRSIDLNIYDIDADGLKGEAVDEYLETCKDETDQYMFREMTDQVCPVSTVFCDVYDQIVAD